MIEFFSPLFFYAIATGLCAGIVAGLFGVGGGIIIVPALLFLFHLMDFPSPMVMQMAVGTSLATIIFTNTVATWNQHRRQSVNWSAVAQYTPGILMGAWLGAWLAIRLDGGLLQMVFGLFEIGIGLRMISSRKTAETPQQARTVHPLVTPWVGVLIGAISALFGIGGGTLSVPALTLISRLPIHLAVGSSSAIGIFLAISGAFGFLQGGWSQINLPAGSWGYIIPEAFFGIVTGTLITTSIGVKLAHSLSPILLKKSFGFFLLVVGVRLMMG
ncbi:MAG: sulfite exporter TauE/SafE family protein [Magnetococcales bacterium]|nr:sulfite exporter TauE/SafE family protein [Magnetococcales bacterium]